MSATHSIEFSTISHNCMECEHKLSSLLKHSDIPIILYHSSIILIYLSKYQLICLIKKNLFKSFEKWNVTHAIQARSVKDIWTNLNTKLVAIYTIFI